MSFFQVSQAVELSVLGEAKATASHPPLPFSCKLPRMQALWQREKLASRSKSSHRSEAAAKAAGLKGRLLFVGSLGRKKKTLPL